MDKIVFLDYLSRSGSTFLASRLNDVIGCEVTIETRITKSYDPFEIRIKNIKDIRKFLNFFNTYTKNNVWNLTSTDLISCLSDKKIIRYQDLIKVILKKRDHDFSKKTIVIKGGGNYIINYKRYKENLSNLKIIALDRDPRAIYNSQLKSDDSHLRQPMAKGIYDFCFNYNLYKKNLRRYSGSNILVVSYEELVINPGHILRECTEFLDLDNKIKKDNDYFDSIPESQKHLHGNIKIKSGITERINLWEKELPDEFKRIIGVICLNPKSGEKIPRSLFYYKTKVKYCLFFLKNILSMKLKYIRNEFRR